MNKILLCFISIVILGLSILAHIYAPGYIYYGSIYLTFPLMVFSIVFILYVFFNVIFGANKSVFLSIVFLIISIIGTFMLDKGIWYVSRMIVLQEEKSDAINYNNIILKKYTEDKDSVRLYNCKISVMNFDEERNNLVVMTYINEESALDDWLSSDFNRDYYVSKEDVPELFIHYYDNNDTYNLLEGTDARCLFLKGYNEDPHSFIPVPGRSIIKSVIVDGKEVDFLTYLKNKFSSLNK